MGAGWPSLEPFVRPGYDREFTDREQQAGLDVPVHDGVGVDPGSTIAGDGPVAHRVTWIAGGLPYAACGRPAAMDWLIVPAGTPVIDGAQREVEVCEGCAHTVVTIPAAAPGRVIDGAVADRPAIGG